MTNLHFNVTCFPILRTREQVKVEIFVSVVADLPSKPESRREAISHIHAEVQALVRASSSLWALQFSDAEQTLTFDGYRSLHGLVSKALSGTRQLTDGSYAASVAALKG